jgi:hypothetical protein
MKSGTVTVGTTPTLVCMSDIEQPGIVVQNSGETPVFIGGATVSASGTAAGLSLAAGATLTAPFIGELFAVVASGTGAVAFLTAMD